MAYRYDEKTGEFINSPVSSQDSPKELPKRVSGTEPASEMDGCLKSIINWAIFAALVAMSSILN